MNSSIFPLFSIDRKQIEWEDYIYRPTPVEREKGMWFKRDDHFAPLGYGGLNGTKVRQCIWLMYNYAIESSGVISGSSVKSPQISSGTIIAKHYGLSFLGVIGATNPVSALQHENISIAARMGAKFDIVPVGYNPVLQHRCRVLLSSPAYSNHWYLEYGINLDHKIHPPEEIEDFHRVGASQVANLPTEMKNLVIPAGSCLSAVSILYGLSRTPPANLERIFMFAIGPDRKGFIDHRLQIIEEVTGTKIRDLYPITWYDLHGSGFASYQDRMPWTHGEIVMHPTYEGKVMRYISEKVPELISEDTCFWIVGSEPSWAAMAPNLPAVAAPKELVHA